MLCKIKRRIRIRQEKAENTVQTEINLYEIASKRHAKGLQLACGRLAEDEASQARQAFKRLVSCLQKDCKWLAEAY